MIRPENQPEYLLISITKNCQTLIEQTKTKPQETLEFYNGYTNANFFV